LSKFFLLQKKFGNKNQQPVNPGVVELCLAFRRFFRRKNIRPLSKLAPEDELGGNWRAEERSELNVHEAPSTSIFFQIASGVGFRKRSIGAF
jgi:hypothetical protein